MASPDVIDDPMEHSFEINQSPLVMDMRGIESALDARVSFSLN
jgi:hypothetical protein